MDVQISALSGLTTKPAEPSCNSIVGLPKLPFGRRVYLRIQRLFNKSSCLGYQDILRIRQPIRLLASSSSVCASRTMHHGFFDRGFA